MKPIALKMNYALALVIGGMLAAGPVLADKPIWLAAGKGGNDERMDRRDDQKGGGRDAQKSERRDVQKGEQRDAQKSERRDAQKSEQRDAQKNERRDESRASVRQREHFQDQHRVVVRQYYEEQFRGGRCPPGLKKKNNGCMPPGQAKKWQMGRPLPRDVVYYSVPQPLVAEIGVPPPGYRYVRVANDILMISTGTRMVVDAIRDLGR